MKFHFKWEEITFDIYIIVKWYIYSYSSTIKCEKCAVRETEKKSTLGNNAWAISKTVTLTAVRTDLRAETIIAFMIKEKCDISGSSHSQCVNFS